MCEGRCATECVEGEGGWGGLEGRGRGETRESLNNTIDAGVALKLHQPYRSGVYAKAGSVLATPNIYSGIKLYIP